MEFQEKDYQNRRLIGSKWFFLWGLLWIMALMVMFPALAHC
jgi:hypothetical protein